MKSEYMNYPFSISGNGMINTANEDKHIKDMIEQILFTSGGERLNSPRFGAGIKNTIFSPINPMLETTLKLTITASIQQWLDHLIIVENVDVKSEEEKLFINITYSKIKSREEHTVHFER